MTPLFATQSVVYIPICLSSGQTMSDSPESRSAKPSIPPDGSFPFAPPPSAPGPETVINSDKQPTPNQPPGSQLSGSPAVWALFPPPGQELHEQSPSPHTDIRLGHFQIVQRIGCGGMGSVFQAVDERLQRTVALKVLAPHVARDSQTVQRFQNEARAAARLDHDSIAGVYYVGQDQGLHFIAYEFVAGTNLRDLIQQNQHMSPADTVNLALQIATALKQMAAAGVTHRDIKPSNIIVNADQRSKLVDLGLARKQETDSVGDLTSAGTTMGTFDYIPPEQAKDPRQVDVRSDIYSLGCTLYHMLTGEPPYPEGTMLQKLLDHQGKEPPNPAAKNRRVPANLSDVVRRMMASQPKDRYQNPDQLIRDLMSVARTLGMRSLSTEGLIWAPAKRSARQFWERHLGWMSTAAALVLIVFLLQHFPQLGQQASQPAPAQPQIGSSTGGGLPQVSTDSEPSPGQPNAGANDSLVPFPDSVVAPPEAVANSNVGTGADPAVIAQIFERILPLIEPRRFPTELPFGRSTDAPTVAPMVDSDEPGGAVGVPSGTGTVATARPATDAGGLTTAGPNPLDQTVVPPVTLYTGNDARTFNTLEAACSAATDGDVIELAYHGRRAQDNLEKPLQITEKKVVIRSRSGYRPIITFGSEVATAVSDTRMITLNGGSIEFVNVDLQMLVNDATQTDLWALFSLQDARQIRLQGVTLQVVNPTQRPAAVIEIAGGFDDPAQVKMPSEDTPPRELSVVLSECVVVAESDLFRVRRVKPGRLELTNAALTVQGVMLRLVDGTAMPRENAELELKLDHTTCHIDDSLVRVRCDQMPAAVLPLQFVATNNVFSSADQTTPLIFMDGEAGAEDFLQLISTWYGSHNCYDGFTTFWLARNAEGDNNLIDLDFAAWQQRWLQQADSEDSQASNAPIPWSIAWREQSMQEVSLLSFILDTSRQTRNPAVNAAEELNVGAELGRLPAIPSAKISSP